MDYRLFHWSETAASYECFFHANIFSHILLLLYGSRNKFIEDKNNAWNKLGKHLAREADSPRWYAHVYFATSGSFTRWVRPLVAWLTWLIPRDLLLVSDLTRHLILLHRRCCRTRFPSLRPIQMVKSRALSRGEPCVTGIKRLQEERIVTHAMLLYLPSAHASMKSR